MGCFWSSDLPPGGETSPSINVTPNDNFFRNWGEKVNQNDFFDTSEGFFISEGDGNEYNGSHTKETTKVTVGRDQQGNKIVNQYALIKSLGTGSYGKVKLGIDLVDEKFYAIKICHKGILRRRRIGMSTALQDVVREMAIMKRLDHPNIVKLYEIINDSDHERLYMVLEYMAGGTICKEGEVLEEETACRYFADIITGLDYLHKQNIIHRDIKPENLLVSDDGTCKISDFGVSHVFNGNDDTLSSSAGSPAFLAPELCTAGATASGRAVDIWACGITLYYMLVGHVPFMADNVVDLYEYIREKKLIIPPHVSTEPANLLKQLLAKDPKKRITISEIMTNSWIRHCIGRSFIERKQINSSNEDIQNAIANSFQSFVKLKNKMHNLSKQAKFMISRSESNSTSFEFSDDSENSKNFLSQDDIKKKTKSSSFNRGKENKSSSPKNNNQQYIDNNIFLDNIRIVEDDDAVLDDIETSNSNINNNKTTKNELSEDLLLDNEFPKLEYVYVLDDEQSEEDPWLAIEKELTKTEKEIVDNITEDIPLDFKKH